jgi:hypothetical protein
MSSPFAGLCLADIRQDFVRNIVSVPGARDPFDDLSDDPAEWALAKAADDDVVTARSRAGMLVIDRPFDDAAWFNAIGWPFGHRQQTRFSGGGYGVWYGSESIETTICETAHHWVHGLLFDAGFEHEAVATERLLYNVNCAAALLDFRTATAAYPALLHRIDYAYAQSVGARIHHEGHPGLLIQSVRRSGGECVAIFNPGVLSDPRPIGQLSYRLDGEEIAVERSAGEVWFSLRRADL